MQANPSDSPPDPRLNRKDGFPEPTGVTDQDPNIPLAPAKLVDKREEQGNIAYFEGQTWVDRLVL